MQKNRIYLRKKGDNKNRKKKDFFPPDLHMIIWATLCNIVPLFYYLTTF